MTQEQELEEYRKFHEWLGRRLQSTHDTYDFSGFTNDVHKELRCLKAKLNFASVERVAAKAREVSTRDRDLGITRTPKEACNCPGFAHWCDKCKCWRY